MSDLVLSESRREVLLWAQSVLQSDAELAVDPIVETPWSMVLRIRTAKGNFYLKQTAPDLFIESDVIQMCRNTCGITTIPEVVAARRDLRAFLMTECGDCSLRTAFAGAFKIEVWEQALKEYRSMQQASVGHVEEFLRLGVPDWRLQRLPDVYLALMQDEAFWLSHGIDRAEIRQAQGLYETVRSLCNRLSEYGLAECLGHSDIHDNNVLIRQATQALSIIDLGETAIEHPFFSLLFCLKRTCSRYNMASESLEYKRLYAASFAGFFRAEADVQGAVAVTEKLLSVYVLLGYARLLRATEPEAMSDLPRMVGRVQSYCKAVLADLAGPL